MASVVNPLTADLDANAHNITNIKNASISSLNVGTITSGHIISTGTLQIPQVQTGTLASPYVTCTNLTVNYINGVPASGSTAPSVMGITAEEGSAISITGTAAYPIIGYTGITGLSAANAGVGVSISGSAINPTITNTGVISLTAGDGITLSGTTGNITVSALEGPGGTVQSVTAAAGSAITVTGNNANPVIGYSGITGITCLDGSIYIGGSRTYPTISSVANISSGTGIVLSAEGGGTTKISNAGIIDVLSGIGISATKDVNGVVSLSNTGITSVLSGAGISVSTSQGVASVSNTGVLNPMITDLNGGSHGITNTTYLSTNILYTKGLYVNDSQAPNMTLDNGSGQQYTFYINTSGGGKTLEIYSTGSDNKGLYYYYPAGAPITWNNNNPPSSSGPLSSFSDQVTVGDALSVISSIGRPGAANHVEMYLNNGNCVYTFQNDSNGNLNLGGPTSYGPAGNIAMTLAGTTLRYNCDVNFARPMQKSGVYCYRLLGTFLDITDINNIDHQRDLSDINNYISSNTLPTGMYSVSVQMVLHNITGNANNASIHIVVNTSGQNIFIPLVNGGQGILPGLNLDSYAGNTVVCELSSTSVFRGLLSRGTFTLSNFLLPSYYVTIAPLH